MTVHLLDRHPGHHRAHRARPSRPHPLRALLDAIDLLARWWNWPPVQAYYYRQWRRADRKALAAEMAALRDYPHFCTSEIECEDCKQELDDDELGAPDEDGLNRYRTEPLPPESYPYPLPIRMPRRVGDGFVVLGPDGCELVRRPQFSQNARETSCDMQALPVVPRYLDAMPGGTE